MPTPSGLDDRDHAAHAWRRYRRLMTGMSLFTFICVVIALGWVYTQVGMVSIHLYIATAAGVTVSVMLAAALMGLVFLSNGTGHDASIHNPLEEEDRDV